MAQKVVVGMSGGVDSTVAALLLKQQGYEVTGLFMLNWEEDDELGFCTHQTDFEDVKLVCSAIDIPYYTVNFSRQYLDKVFNNFLYEYSRGRTPNPDVLCNREIKFGVFWDFARGLGADLIATGHYCRVDKSAAHAKLLKAKDEQKDQSYFLNQLNFNQLKTVLFPLGDLHKNEVREIAKKHNLVTHNKKDSTGICFIGERRFKQFLQNYLPAQSGEIRDIFGKYLGKHDGLMYYTIGQRRGLGIGGVKDEGNNRWFVIEKDLKTNTLIVSNGEDDLLFSNELFCENVNWIEGQPPKNEFYCKAKFRYRQPDQSVKVEVVDKGARVIFDSPQRAVTLGQYAVFYDGDVCLGGGAIDKTIKYGL